MTVRPVRIRGLWAAAIFASVLLLSGCGQRPEVGRDELIGTWVYSAGESSVGKDVPAATLELHADHTLLVKDFPLDSISEEHLRTSAISSSGTWEFTPRLDKSEARYENQSGVIVRITDLRKTDPTKVRRDLLVEKDSGGAVRITIYPGGVDNLDRKYVLSKQT
ncbi:hypothetical protein ABIE18_004453 [Arthrobacter sp. 2762]